MVLCNAIRFALAHCDLLRVARPLSENLTHLLDDLGGRPDPESVGQGQEIGGGYVFELAIDRHQVLVSPLTGRVVGEGYVVGWGELPGRSFTKDKPKAGSKATAPTRRPQMRTSMALTGLYIGLSPSRSPLSWWPSFEHL